LINPQSGDPILNADRNVEGAVAKPKMNRVHPCEVERFGAAQKAPSHAQARGRSVDSDRDPHAGNEAAQDSPISATELQDAHRGRCFLENKVDLRFEIGLDSGRSQVIAGMQAFGS
jgi:hypothetical protein